MLKQLKWAMLKKAGAKAGYVDTAAIEFERPGDLVAS